MSAFDSCAMSANDNEMKWKYKNCRRGTRHHELLFFVLFYSRLFFLIADIWFLRTWVQYSTANYFQSLSRNIIDWRLIFRRLKLVPWYCKRRIMKRCYSISFAGIRLGDLKLRTHPLLDFKKTPLVQSLVERTAFSDQNETFRMIYHSNFFHMNEMYVLIYAMLHNLSYLNL